jgi:flagella basal body P-ring formation protein FlgA
MIDWLVANGRAAPNASSIGPLDPRLSIEPCDQVEVTPRGATGSSYTMRCKAGAAWTYTVRLDQIAPPSAQVAQSAFSGGATAAQGSWRVVAPKIDLPTGAILSPEVLEERIVNAPPPGQALKSISDAIGLRVTSPVGPGLTLTTYNVARAPLVAKGENVTLVANGSGFNISVPGKAEQDGYEGDLILVRNARSGAVLKGRLERGKIVSVMQL